MYGSYGTHDDPEEQKKQPYGVAPPIDVYQGDQAQQGVPPPAQEGSYVQQPQNQDAQAQAASAATAQSAAEKAAADSAAQSAAAKGKGKSIMSLFGL